jgi:poly-gamma-glutamate synthase PgsB/CapB
MAINPIYQKYLEEKIMHSTIGVITNVREDHMDLLGKTLPEIAKSLCSTVPVGGHLVTAETDEELIKVMRTECDKRNTELHLASAETVTDAEMSKFQHFEYKSNVAIALEIARLCGVKRGKALKGMYKAMPDPGAFVLKTYSRGFKQMHWANLFAINDRESFVMTARELTHKVNSNAKMVVILNNRQDRPERVGQFVDIAVNSVQADYIVTFGDYEKQVQKEVSKFGTEREIRVIHMGNDSKHRNATGQELLEIIIGEITETEFMVLGAVNIHTKQSQSLLNALGESYAH